MWVTRRLDVPIGRAFVPTELFAMRMRNVSDPSVSTITFASAKLVGPETASSAVLIVTWMPGQTGTWPAMTSDAERTIVLTRPTLVKKTRMEMASAMLATTMPTMTAFPTHPTIVPWSPMPISWTLRTTVTTSEFGMLNNQIDKFTACKS